MVPGKPRKESIIVDVHVTTGEVAEIASTLGKAAPGYSRSVGRQRWGAGRMQRRAGGTWRLVRWKQGGCTRSGGEGPIRYGTHHAYTVLRSRRQRFPGTCSVVVGHHRQVGGASLDNHVRELIATDFFTVPSATFRVLFVFVVLSHERRRILHFNVTEHPTAEWTARQLLEVVGERETFAYLVRDRDRSYGKRFSRTGVRFRHTRGDDSPKLPVAETGDRNHPSRVSGSCHRYRGTTPEVNNEAICSLPQRYATTLPSHGGCTDQSVGVKYVAPFF